MNNIWWTQIPSARHFLGQITETLLMCKSVLLSVPEWLPWADALYAEVENSLIAHGSAKSLKCIDCPADDIGRFLLENYCKKEKRAQYRPTETPASFLARNSDIGLNHYYIWVKNISPERLRSWKSSSRTIMQRFHRVCPAPVSSWRFPRQVLQTPATLCRSALSRASRLMTALPLRPGRG